MLKVVLPGPGIIKDDTPYVAQDAWVDGDKIRFYRKKPQSIGGWQYLVTDQLSGKARGIHAWTDWNKSPYLAIGTHRRLYGIYGGVVYNITPTVEYTSTLTNPFDVTSGLYTVTVHHTSHGLADNDVVSFSGVTAVGGITPTGAYQITYVDADTYTFTNEVAATSTVTGGGGTVTYVYPKKVLTDPFDTTLGDETVTVTEISHGREVGDSVFFYNATAVGGLTIDGEYTVATVPTDDTFTIEASSAASGTATGGGSVSRLYEITAGNESYAPLGYGSGPYGHGPYGGGLSTDNITYLQTWSLSHFRNDLIACPAGGKIYEWPRALGGRAISVNNAPDASSYVFTSPDRYLVSLGTRDSTLVFDPLLVRWSDLDDRYDWTASSTNLAGAYPLQEGSKLVTGVPTHGFHLLWTDTALYSMTLTGETDSVYKFELIGKNCGAAGPNACVERNGYAYWVSPTLQFFSYTGLINKIPCSMQKFFEQNVDRGQISKIYASLNSLFNEVWWFYPTLTSGGECSRYIVYNFVDDCWYDGELSRTCMLDDNVIPYPVAVDPDGYVYEHETGTTDNGNPFTSYIQSGDINLQEGDSLLFIKRFVPDMTMTCANIQMTFTTKKYPNDEEPVVKGPYPAAQTTKKISLRARGRSVSLKAYNDNIGFWRLGNLRVDIQDDGMR